MKKVDFNYAVNTTGYSIWAKTLLCFCALGLLMLFVFFFKKYNALHDAYAAKMLENTPVKSERISPEFNETLAYAKQTKEDLNFPWLRILSSMEAVKAENKNVSFLKVAPSKAKAQILLEGEAKDFSDVVKLISDLKANALFSDAELIHHFLVEDVTVNVRQRKPIYSFKIRVDWQA